MEASKKQVLKMIEQNDRLMDEHFFKDEGNGKDGSSKNKWTTYDYYTYILIVYLYITFIYTSIIIN